MTPHEVADDVWCIDGKMIDESVLSVFLIVDEAPTLIDTGTARSVDAIQTGISELDMDVGDITNIVVSHVHADHSGGAGELVTAATEAKVYIHESTCSYLTDPTRLIESSDRALGKYFKQMGEQTPVPENRIVPIPTDGATLDVGSQTLDIRPITGHSPDHVVVWVPETEILFANEALGYHFPKTDTWLPPATIPNFDVDTVAKAIDTLRSFGPQCIELSHFGEWNRSPDEAFSLAEDRLAYFDDRIPALFRECGDATMTEQAVADDLLNLAPAYDPMVERLYARLLTYGYLLDHDLI